MRRITVLVAAMLAVIPLAAGAAQPTPRVRYIHAGALLARPGEAPRGASTIVVRDRKIAEVRDGYLPPEVGAEVIDLKNRFVIPGLIDMHVHLWGVGGDPLRARLNWLTSDDADNLIQAIDNARVTLEAGFTTVRDVGGNARGMRALREGLERGSVAGPTIINAGAPISVSGGHADATAGVAAVFAEATERNQINTCDGPDDCRRAVRKQVALGAQVIKYMSTGGVLSNVSGGLGRAMTPDEMQAIVETAHALGRRVATHSHGASGTKAAIAAGVDTVEHGSFLDDEAIRMLKDSGTWLVPTMLASPTLIIQAKSGALPPAVVPKAEQSAAAAFNSHSRAFAAGVKVAFGTDAGVSKHGENALEFALMVRAGMTPAQAIKTATLNAAEALGRAESIGSIEPGKDADIIAVSGSPIEDVTRLQRVDFVMRQGVVHKSAGRRQVFPLD